MAPGMWGGTGWYPACPLATDGNVEKLGPGVGQFGTYHTLGWWDWSGGVTVSPKRADHIGAELPRLFPLPTHGVSILGHPSQTLRQRELRWVVYESTSGWLWGPPKLKERSIPCWGHPTPDPAEGPRGWRKPSPGALLKSRLGLFIFCLLFQAYYVNS